MKRREAVAGLIIAALVVLALMAVFAVQLSNNQAKSRRDIESRVHERSMLAAALIDSLFQTIQQQVPQEARLYGSPKVSNRLLDSKRATNSYLALLNASGTPIAYSHGFDAQARADLNRSATLKLLKAGKPWALGNVLPYGKTGVINYGVTLPTKSGMRYLLTGLDPATLSPFLLGELRQIPGVKGAYNYVFDGAGVVIASTNPKRPPGYRLHTRAQMAAFAHTSGDVNGHYYDQVRLGNSTWRILLAAPNGPLFASVSGVRKWLPWLIFTAFGIVAAVTLALARRALRDNDRVRLTNARLEEANASLAEVNEQLAQTNQTLAETNTALEISNSELERRARELARSNAELDQFASIASHDLQEPLRKVRTFTERISQTEGDALSERGLDYLHRANASAERMQRLIEDLLTFSRVATQGRPFTEVDLGTVTKEVIEDLEESINSTGAEVRVGALPTINADPHQMRQLVQNLLSNAIKFNRPGVTPQIDISAETDGDLVKLMVRDNGIGFDPQYGGRIFRVFERLHGRGTYPGTGIGLALCRKIAERHGGTVVGDSVPGEGSVFTVTLQRQRSEAAAAAAAAGEDQSAPAASEEPYAVA
jgi:signal transduction histidine kinase